MTKLQMAETHACDMEYDEEEAPPQDLFSGDIALFDALEEDLNAVCLSLDGKMTSHLDWSPQLEHASRLMERGVHILWNLDLGLFNALQRPLKDETQLQSLKLSLQHFKETVWEPFKAKTIGVCIYADTVSFESFNEQEAELTLPFDEWVREKHVEVLDPQLARAYWRRDILSAYLSTLTASVPEGLRLFARMDIPEMFPLSAAVALMNPDCFERIEWLLTAPHRLHSAWSLHGNTWVPSSSRTSPVGICVPMSQWKPQTLNAVDGLLKKHSTIRFIPEEAILSGWEQLDRIFVVESELTPFGKRQLQGFQAAGGAVEYL